MRFILSILFYIIFITSSWAQADYSSIIKEDKLSLTFGMGHQFGVVGLNGAYSLSDVISVSALLSVYSKLGVEFSAPNLLKTPRLEPYFKVQFGITEALSLASCDFFQGIDCFGPDVQYERKTFYGPTLSLGTKFKLLKKLRGHGTISLDYNHVDKGQLESYYNTVNEMFGTMHVLSSGRNVFFSIGYAYLLKSTNPDYKR